MVALKGAGNVIGSGAAPARVDVHSRDRDVAAEVANRMVPHHPRIDVHRSREVHFSYRAASYEKLSALRLELAGMRYAASVPAVPAVMAGLLLTGRAQIQVPGGVSRLGAEDGWMFPEGAPTEDEWDDTRLLFVSLPHAYVADVAEGTTGLPAADLSLVAGAPVSADLGRLWAHAADFLSAQVVDPEVDHPPLVVDGLMQMTAAMMLTVFPNSTMTSARVPPPGAVGPAPLRRAIAFMEENAGRPLTLSEIAAAAGTGPRALQEASRRHLGTTPLRHLRRIRLDRAHDDLRAADPSAGATVADIARRWGFADPSRFTAQYRAAYGQVPSRTLRSS